MGAIAEAEELGTILLSRNGSEHTACLEGQENQVWARRSCREAAIGQMIDAHREDPAFKRLIDANPNMFAEKNAIHIGRLVLDRGIEWGLKII